MQIRPITEDDIDPLIHLWGECGLTRPWNDPYRDIKIAQNAPNSDVFILLEEDEIRASAMAGFDGHRAWIYYVAVKPGHQGKGLARAIVEHAETYLKRLGAPKVMVMVRNDNLNADNFWHAMGYVLDPTDSFGKWLIEPPVRRETLPDNGDAVPNLEVTKTYLEMKERPNRAARPCPVLEHPVSLLKLDEPTVAYYRYLHHGVGDAWLWWERRTWDDAKLEKAIHDPNVEIFVPYVGGEPAGFVELDFSKEPEEVYLAYFGLMPHFIGMGLGPWLLDWAVDHAWDRDPAPNKLTLNTCSLDHPKALGGYQRAGFVPTERVVEQVPDPRARGIIPKSATVLSPIYGADG